jgi:hypothetical protein
VILKESKAPNRGTSAHSCSDGCEQMPGPLTTAALEIAATTKHRWAMPLRNFGLTSFRVSARPDVGVTRSPAHGVGVTFLILMLIVLALMLG